MLSTKRTYTQWCSLWNRCHDTGVDVRNQYVVMSWAKWVEDMIGPDNCLGFIIRDRREYLKDLWLSDGPSLFVKYFCNATIYNWDNTAVKIANERTLEAVRIDKKGVAVDSSGLIVNIFNKEELTRRGIYDSDAS